MKYIKPVCAMVMLLFCCVIVSASDVIVVSRTAKVNQSFDVTVLCKPTTFIKSFECRLRFNNSILKANSIDEGGFFGDYDVFASPHMGIINNTKGIVMNIYELVIGQGNVTSDGILFTVNFTALHNGSAFVELYNVGLTNETKYLPVDVLNGLVVVDGILYDEPVDNQSKNDTKKDDLLPGDVGKNDAGKQGADNKYKNPLTDMTSILIMVLVSLFVVLVVLKKVVF